jgi:hypothetical protein
MKMTVSIVTPIVLIVCSSFSDDFSTLSKDGDSQLVGRPLGIRQGHRKGVCPIHVFPNRRDLHYMDYPAMTP